MELCEGCREKQRKELETELEEKWEASKDGALGRYKTHLLVDESLSKEALLGLIIVLGEQERMLMLE